MPSFTASSRILLAGLALASLAACSVGGIGDGNKPESVRVIRVSSLLDTARTESYLCFRDQLQLITDFTNGGASNDTLRARWTSSNPAVLAVSNGDIFIPGSTELVYQKGTLIPRAESNTPVTITAEFVGLVATYEVSAVRKPTEIRIEPLSQTMAFVTAGSMKAKAVIDGFTLDVTNQAEWSFATEDDDVATIGQFNGAIVSKGKVGDLTVQAKFPECPAGSGLEGTRTADLHIRRVAGLSMTREFAAAGGELIKDTTEALKVIASFVDSTETQDVSTQLKTSYKFSPTTQTSLGVGLVGARNFVNAAANTTGPVTITAEFTETFRPAGATEDSNVKTVSNGLDFTVATRTLEGITVTPDTATMNALGTQQFTATGSFDGGAASQDITRHVTWSSSEPTVVFVPTGALPAAGIAIALKSTASTAPITLTAKRTGGTTAAPVELSDTATVNVVVPPAP
ncbi:MAG TPA: hypothetical protein VFV11_04725 [Solimonas sp.]|nr:hypothetical protein [Solimonas sp.]